MVLIYNCWRVENGVCMEKIVIYDMSKRKHITYEMRCAIANAWSSGMPLNGIGIDITGNMFVPHFDMKNYMTNLKS